MDLSENYHYIKDLFSDYVARTVSSSGMHRDQVALGGFIALLAVKISYKELTVPEDVWSKEGYFRKFISDFEGKYLHQIFYSKDSVYFIPFGDEMLHRLLYGADFIKNDLDVELLELLNVVLKEQSTGLAMYETPMGLSNLLVRASGVMDYDVAFDPAMGSGGLLNALSECGFENLEFVGAEPVVWNQVIVCLKSILLNFRRIRIYNGSVFEFKKSNRKIEFDRVISSPPVGKISIEARLEYRDNIPNPSSDLSLNFIELGLQCLKSTGSAAFLVNIGALFSVNDSKFVRESWLDRGLLRGVVSLPAGLLPHTGLKCALIVFGVLPIKGLSADKIRFVKAEDCATRGAKRKLQLSDLDITEILLRLNDGEDKANVVDVTYKSISEKTFNLDPASYFVESKIQSNLKLTRKWVKVADLADVFAGMRIAKMPDGDQTIVQGRDIRVDSLDIKKMQKKNLSGFSNIKRLTKKNDVLVQRIGASPAVYLVKESEQGIFVADTLFIIRFRNLARDIIEFIVHYMNSDWVSKRLSNAQTYSVVQTQSLKSIRELEVPLPDSEVVASLKQLVSLEKTLKDEYGKVTQYKESMFGGDDSIDLENHLASTRFTVETLTSALDKKGDINNLVADQYPFPIAYSFRNIYAERDLASIYERQMKYGEQFLAFLVALGFSLVWEYCEKADEDGLVKVLVEDFSSKVDIGLSPGDWQVALQRCCKVLKEIDNDMCREFSRIWFKSPGRKESSFAGETKTSIVVPLNDFKHHRGPANKHERSAKIASQKKALEKVLEDVEFLTKWDLILIEDLDKGWQKNNFEIEASLLKGDHPAFKPVKFASLETLSKNKLYIRYGDNFIPLYPMLSVIYNEQTKRDEIFGFDKRSNHMMGLRSFDSGTSVDNRQVSQDFAQWVKLVIEKNS